MPRCRVCAETVAGEEGRKVRKSNPRTSSMGGKGCERMKETREEKWAPRRARGKVDGSKEKLGGMGEQG